MVVPTDGVAAGLQVESPAGQAVLHSVATYNASALQVPWQCSTSQLTKLRLSLSLFNLDGVLETNENQQHQEPASDE